MQSGRTHLNIMIVVLRICSASHVFFIRTARPAKVKWLSSFCGSKIEIIAVDDLATADFTEALRGNGFGIAERYHLTNFI